MGQFGLPDVKYTRFFISSQTYTIAASDAGIYRLSIMGAGGSGAVQADAGGKVSATGGGGGGFSEKILSLASGDALVITIGAGGAGQVSAAYAAGVAGGDSSIVCAAIGLNMTAGGGKGGVGGTANGTYAGGAGGVGAGGDLNATGGAGGEIVQPAGASTLYASGGGAAGSPFGTGGHGGNMSADAGVNPSTGGGGVGGGHGGAITGLNEKATGGGSAMESGAANTTTPTSPGRNGLGLYSTTSIDGFVRTGASTSSIEKSFGSISDPFRSLLGGGSVSVQNTSPSPNTYLGGGSGGGVGVASSPTGNAFCGGGTGGMTVATNASGVSGSCTFGGGSGGIIDGFATSQTSGAGGKAIACVERIA
jgi:hypothetical protein